MSFFSTLKQDLRWRLGQARQALRRRFVTSRFHPQSEGLWDLFEPEAQARRLATGFQFTEGPIWLEREQCLLFSDIPGNRIHRLTSSGEVSIFREPSHNSNGLTLDLEGRLIACEHGTRRVTRTESDGSITVLADEYNSQPLNSPNDVVVKSDGSIYFTDPPYGIRPEQQKLPFQGVYRWSEDEGLKLVVDDFEHPNGLAFSLDESRLYIDDSSDLRHLRVFNVESDGSLSGGAVHTDMNLPSLQGRPDGMKLDCEGNLYCTGPGGLWILRPDQTVLGRLELPEQPANLNWGDRDRQGLYITARTSIYHIRTRLCGATRAT